MSWCELRELVVLTVLASVTSGAVAIPSAPRGVSVEEPDSSQAAATRRFEAPEARQAVAVGERYFYVIGNRVIGKYDKQSGRRLAV